MQIEFKKLIIHNFMSFSDCEFNFDNGGYILVSGNNLFPLDSTNSNGSGKSSLFESIFWCITGETVRGTKNVLKQGKDECIVSMKLFINGEDVLITRKKSTKQDLQICINGVDKSCKGIRDTEKLFQQLFPDLTNLLLSSTILFGQGLPNRFTGNTPSGRKEVLENLTNSDFMIFDIKERTNKRKKLLQDTITKLNQQASEVGGIKSAHEKSLFDVSNKIDDLSNNSGSLIDINKLEFEKNQLIDRKNYINSELSKLKISIHTCQQNLQIASDNYYSNKEFCNNKYKDLKSEHEKKLCELNIEKQHISEQITEFESNGGVCIECGHEIDEFDLILQEKFDLCCKYQQDISDVTRILEHYSVAYDQELSTIEKSYEEDKTNILNLQTELSNSYQTYEKELENIIKRINSIESTIQVETTKIETTQKYLNQMLSQKQNYIDEIAKLEKNLLYINSEVEKYNLKLDFVDKILTLLSRDFRGVLLQNIIEYINNISNDFSTIVFGSRCIDILLDGNNLNISLNNKEYEQLSSGERQKVDIILQFSIRSLLTNYYGFSCNTIILDEIFDSLDSSGCDKIIDLLNYALKDISNIFIISHRKDLSIPFDKRFQVEKGIDGDSRLNVIS